MGCVQSTLCIYVHSYITWMPFLFLGNGTQFQKTIINLIMLSVCNENFSSNSVDFKDVLYSTFRISVEEIQFLLKYNKNNEYFTLRRIYIY